MKPDLLKDGMKARSLFLVTCLEIMELIDQQKPTKQQINTKTSTTGYSALQRRRLHQDRRQVRLHGLLLLSMLLVDLAFIHQIN